MNFNTSNNLSDGSTYGDRNVILCTFLIFQLPYQPAPKEVADKVIENQKINNQQK